MCFKTCFCRLLANARCLQKQVAQEPLEIDLPPIPTDARDMPQFQADMDAIFSRFEGQIDIAGLDPAYQRAYKGPRTSVRQEELADAEARAQRRVERIHKWVRRHLTWKCAYSNRRIKVDPQDVVFTDHKSRPALMRVGVKTWPLQRR